ncbi:hypothetical protein [Ruegeria arenilitoris]|uniref:hypothetical protein n=1 Tax=Ruegeria arenilitoris TaxID=1173585 RepID=UPI00147B64FA|nr:hypothetical protein [Ruegeria arenilitoris]
MTDLPNFSKVKIQCLTEMVQDADLADSSFRAASLLFLKYADHVSGECYPSFETVGSVLGKHPKSVKRALTRPALAAYLIRKPGTNKGNSSRYKPTKNLLLAAQSRKSKQGKNALQKATFGAQSYPQTGTFLGDEAVRNCPPNKDQEQRKKTTGSTKSLLQEEQTSLEPVFVKTLDYSCKEWESLCQKLSGKSLEELLGTSELNGTKGFFLSEKWPPRELRDYELFRKEMEYLRQFQTNPVSAA